MKKDETIQNYLEAIHILSLKNKEVRSIDVANYLSFSRPTVSIALRDLAEKGYISFDNTKVVLTEKGKNVATSMYERHEYIAKLLIKLGVDEKIAYEDSCLIEHDISQESFEAIKNATKDFVK